MFESTLLDKLSRVHPTVPLYIFVPAIVVLFTLGARESTTLGSLALATGGYFFWTLTEYWMHRLIFHFEPEEGLGARLHWIIHGVHHDHPNDPLRLVMPPSVSIPLALGFWGLFMLVLGTPWANVFTGRVTQLSGCGCRDTEPAPERWPRWLGKIGLIIFPGWISFFC